MFSSQVEEIVASQLITADLDRSKGYYEFVGRGCTSTLKFLPCELDCGDFSLVSIAEITTVFESGSFPDFDEAGIQELNGGSTYGAYFLVDGNLTISAQFSIYEEEPATRLAAYMILEAFGGQKAFGYAQPRSEISEDIFRQSRTYLEMPRQWSDPVTVDEFRAAADVFTHHGLVSTGFDGGFTLEIPLSGELPSRMLDHRAQTALLKVSTNISHPLAGTGYLCTIALPVDPLESQIVNCSHSLNTLELKQDDFVPRFGAWGTRLLGTELVYSSFFPSSRRFGDLHQTMMSWNVTRTRWLRDNYWDPDYGVVITPNTADDGA